MAYPYDDELPDMPEEYYGSELYMDPDLQKVDGLDVSVNKDLPNNGQLQWGVDNQELSPKPPEEPAAAYAASESRASEPEPQIAGDEPWQIDTSRIGDFMDAYSPEGSTEGREPTATPAPMPPPAQAAPAAMQSTSVTTASEPEYDPYTEREYLEYQRQNPRSDMSALVAGLLASGALDKLGGILGGGKGRKPRYSTAARIGQARSTGRAQALNEFLRGQQSQQTQYESGRRALLESLRNRHNDRLRQVENAGIQRMNAEAAQARMRAEAEDRDEVRRGMTPGTPEYQMNVRILTPVQGQGFNLDENGRELPLTRQMVERASYNAGLRFISNREDNAADMVQLETRLRAQSELEHYKGELMRQIQAAHDAARGQRRGGGGGGGGRNASPLSPDQEYSVRADLYAQLRAQHHTEEMARATAFGLPWQELNEKYLHRSLGDAGGTNTQDFQQQQQVQRDYTRRRTQLEEQYGLGGPVKRTVAEAYRAVRNTSDSDLRTAIGMVQNNNVVNIGHSPEAFAAANAIIRLRNIVGRAVAGAAQTDSEMARVAQELGISSQWLPQAPGDLRAAMVAIARGAAVDSRKIESTLAQEFPGFAPGEGFGQAPQSTTVEQFAGELPPPPSASRAPSTGRQPRTQAQAPAAQAPAQQQTYTIRGRPTPMTAAEAQQMADRGHPVIDPNGNPVQARSR